MTTTIDNVVFYEYTTTKVYPQYLNGCGCMINAIHCIVLNGDTFKSIIEPTEEVNEYIHEVHPIEIKINMHPNAEKEWKNYNKMRLQLRINSSEKVGNSIGAHVGDIIEVYKGRKWPIGTQFVVKEQYVYYNKRDIPVRFYWVDEFGRRVDQENCIIVGHKEEL